MNNLVKLLMLGGSVTALAAGSAFAQDTAAGAAGTQDIETVNSSASRLELKGFEAPTPVTVIGVEQLNRDSQVELGDELRELPQVRGGGSITTGSNAGNISQLNAGIDTISLRNLGASRNLVLFDHQRVVASSLQEGAAGGSLVDIAQVPSGLVQRVDVVTGGASAAWGSDAVTGVINIVINKTFEGFKGSATYADSTETSNPVYKLSLAWGTSFLGGKGHTVAGYDYTQDSTPIFTGNLWKAHAPNGRQFVYNSAYCGAVAYPAGKTTGGTCSAVTGQPLLTYGYGVGSATVVVGGLVASNSSGTAGSPIGSNGTYLKGTMFQGDDAAPSQFNYGTLYGASSCYNGCTNNQFTGGGWGTSNNPYHSAVYFSYTSYQLTPDIKASVQLNYTRLSERIQGSNSSVNGTNKTVYADNPYLPDSVAQSFVCQGGAVFGTAGSPCIGTLSNGYNPYTHTNDSGGTVTTLAARQARPSQSMAINFEFAGNRPNSGASAQDNNSAIDYTWDEKCAALEQNCGYGNKALMRGVFTLEGVLSDDWTWNSYIQWGMTRVNEHVANPITVRVNNALDAVRITSGNVGTSGLPVGSIQCRGLLNPALASPVTANTLGVSTAGELAGCVPFDPFGTGAASQATYNYTRPGDNVPATGSENFLQDANSQTAAAFAMNGVLPWKLPAGEIAVAMGGEWRLEQACICKLDARSLLTMYPSGNIVKTFFAKTHVEEGFAEFGIPILKDQFVEDLNLDVAGRITDYSFSGLVETWKIGATSQLNDDVKLRLTWSYDIRAPGIWDLYSPGGISNITAPSFIVGPTGSNLGNPNNAQAIAGGNPNLVPEKANTIAAGVVLTPSFIPGLTASVDWYQIHLHGAIVSTSLATNVSHCQTGELVYCSSIVFDRSGSFAAAKGCGAAGIGNYCAGGDTTSQIDYVYTTPLNASELNTAGVDFAMAYGFDLLTGQMTISANGNYVYDFSRTLLGITFNGAGNTNGYYSGGPKFSGTLNFDYREGAWSFGVTERITGESVMDPGAEGIAGITTQGVTYSQVGANGMVQNVPTVGSGQRDPITGATTNYNAATVQTDLRVQYRWTNNISLFGAVDNIQDLPTVNTPLRRTYRFGVRWAY